MKTRLFDVTELVENNDKYILLRVTGSPEACIGTGVLYGDETMIRVHRDGHEDICIWRNNGTHYSWESNHIVSESMHRLRKEIMLCIQFGYKMPFYLEGLEWPLSIQGKKDIPDSLQLLLYDNDGAVFGPDGVNLDHSVLVRMASYDGLFGHYRLRDVLEALGPGADVVQEDDGPANQALVMWKAPASRTPFVCKACGGTVLHEIIEGRLVCPVEIKYSEEGALDFDATGVAWQKSDYRVVAYECAVCHTAYDSIEEALESTQARQNEKD